jgi:hypothetical protein
VVGLITDNDETAYREVRDNNLFFNVDKTKELIVDYRKQRAEHIDRALVERFESFKFLCVHLCVH